MTREAAVKMHVVTGFSYTIETVLQASCKGLAIEFVPITTNTVTRPSRLFRSIPQFVVRSGLTMLRVAFMFRPLAVLMTISAILAMIGVIPVVRFLIFWAFGDSSGHIQSLVLGGVFLVLAGITSVAALLADLMAANRRLLEMTLEKVKRMECKPVNLILLATVLLCGCSSKAESPYDENIQCRSPNGMRETKTLKRWKFDRVRTIILETVPEGEIGMAYSELIEKVTPEISQEDQMRIGNVKWHIESTVLEMETAQELTRFPDTQTPLPKNVKR